MAQTNHDNQAASTLSALRVVIFSLLMFICERHVVLLSAAVDMSHYSPLPPLPLMRQLHFEILCRRIVCTEFQRFCRHFRHLQNWRDELWTCLLPLCDAAVSVRWSSPYKYSSWLMDPAAAVCCPMEHGHIMYTPIQTVQKHVRCVCCCSRSVSQAPLSGKSADTDPRIFWCFFFFHYFFCLYSNLCRTDRVTTTVSAVLSVAPINFIHKFKELRDYSLVLSHKIHHIHLNNSQSLIFWKYHGLMSYTFFFLQSFILGTTFIPQRVCALGVKGVCKLNQMNVTK